MSYIINTWDLHDFCYSHGRVIPHYFDNEGHFTKFHCADRRHDNSETIICSEGQGVQIGTMVGILTMKGYVVEFNDKDQYLFCTKDELELLKEESEREKALIDQQRKEAEANDLCFPCGSSAEHLSESMNCHHRTYQNDC